MDLLLYLHRVGMYVQERDAIRIFIALTPFVLLPLPAYLWMIAQIIPVALAQLLLYARQGAVMLYRIRIPFTMIQDLG